MDVAQRAPTVDEALEQEQTAAAPAPRGRRRRLLAVAALAAASPALWYVATQPIASMNGAAGSGGGSAKGVGPQVDYQAPNFTLKDLSGKSVQLKDFRGRPVLLNFWATWCLPCREEMPEMEQLYREYKAQGLVVLAVSIDSEASHKDIPAFLQAGDPKVGPYTFPVVLDSKMEVMQTYKLIGVPQSYFIDPEGVIRVVQPRAMSRQIMLDGLRAVMEIPA